MSKKLSDLDLVTTISDNARIGLLDGTNKAILFSDLKKILGGGTGASSGGTSNIFKTPTDMSLSNASQWVQYTPKGELTRPGGLKVVIVNGSTGENDIYQSFGPSILVPGTTFTLGASVVRTAGSGTGKVRGVFYNEGNSTNYYQADQTIQDGVAFIAKMTYTVPTGNTANIHAGFDFTVGGGEFVFQNVTLVSGTTYNPNAT